MLVGVDGNARWFHYHGVVFMSCKIFIDESGDAGIKKIRDENSRGASPYFVMAAAVIPSKSIGDANELLKAIREDIPKNWKHATDLTHPQTVHFARKASKLDMRIFAVISKKSTLGAYKNTIDQDSHKFYNKCAVYLLECVGSYLSTKGMFDCDPDIIFEDCNHDFDKLRRYIRAIKNKPKHTRAHFLKCFNQFGIVTRTKTEEPLLQFADLVAFSAYQCVNKTATNFEIPEPRYLRELEPRFGADQKGTVLEHGLKCIHSLDQLELDDDIKAMFMGLKAPPPLPIIINKHGA